jgi:predicted metal-dependent phosphoesterase TrpH
VSGIEITAVEDGRDVHVLGYFINRDCAELIEFLAVQRADRLRRVRTMTDRLAAMGCSIDIGALLQSAMIPPGRSIGRPQLADALVAAGHASDRRDAFDRLLGDHCPAFVPRRGGDVAQVIRIIQGAGGLASLAHPGLLGMDDRIPQFAAAGLDGIEARHSDHDAILEEKYRQIAAQLGLVVSGGSDFHGDESHDGTMLGVVTLSQTDFDALAARAERVHTGSTLRH